MSRSNKTLGSGVTSSIHFHLLMIAYEFPPLNSGGSHRPLRYANEMARQGVKVTVVTVKHDHFPEDRLDHGLMDGLDERINIVRTDCKERKWHDWIYDSYYFNTIDRTVDRWKSYLIDTINSIQQEENIDLIYLTVPPFSLATICSELKMKFQTPLVLDMRDPWSLWNVTPYPSYLHYLRTRKHEKRALLAADHVIVATSQFKEDFLKQYKGIDPNGITVITNSYTEKIDFVKGEPKPGSSNSEGHFTICYVGSFYYRPNQRRLVIDPWWKKKPWQYFQYIPRKEDWLYRSPYYFFKALKVLLGRRPEYGQCLKVEIIGNREMWLQDMISDFGLDSNVSLLGRVDHMVALEHQKKANALLITSLKVYGGRDYFISGKTFEYVSHLKPIIAFVANGTQKDIIEKTGLGVICDPDNTGNSADKLEELVDGRITLHPNKSFIKSLHISEKTRQMMKVFQKVSGLTGTH